MILERSFSLLVFNSKTTADNAQRVKTITKIAMPPMALLCFFTIFALLTNFHALVAFNLFVIGLIATGVYLVRRHHFGRGKAIIILAVALTCFIYFKQFDTEYYIFCYFFPLVFGLFTFFDFNSEWRSFYTVIVFTVIFCIGSLFLPARLFGNPDIPEWVTGVSQVLNIFFSAVMCFVYMIILIRITVTRERELLLAKDAAEEASRAKASFLSNMSHELRTPLNGIIGTAHILQHEPVPAEVKDHILVMRHLSEHMTSLINDILDYSKIESGKFELHHTRFNAFELFKKLEVIFRNTLEDKSLFLKMDIDTRLAETDLSGDEMRLMQVMTNLISNAIKFTEKGGITVYASIVKKQQGQVKMLAGVRDTGIGIEKEKLGEIFESFNQGDSATTRKYGGTGLGLTISRSIVQMFGGKMFVNSQPGKGSNFYFSADLEALVKTKVNAAMPVTANKKLSDMKVLVAEDNHINMIVVKKFLQKWNVEVTTAINGKEAVEKFAKNQFDLVLLDLEMPEMDGRNAAKLIRAMQPDIPLIAFTAAFYENIKMDLEQYGFSDYLPKPFKPDDLYKKISGVFAGNRVLHSVQHLQTQNV
jgi:signal transduction histidine kinase/CheY-like chemotaxis protein